MLKKTFIKKRKTDFSSLLTSECGEAILVEFSAESTAGKKEVGDDEDGADTEKERSPPVHQEEGEDQ